MLPEAISCLFEQFLQLSIPIVTVLLLIAYSCGINFLYKWSPPVHFPLLKRYFINGYFYDILVLYCMCVCIVFDVCTMYVCVAVM